MKKDKKISRREALRYGGLLAYGAVGAYLGVKAGKVIGPEDAEEKDTSDIITIGNMKVLLLNGSPHKQGCTYTALSEIAATLSQEGIGSEIIHIGTGAVQGCMACRACAKTGLCVVDDRVNEIIERSAEFDGMVLGSPVHYAAASGFITPFLDRLFYAGSRNFAHKPGAAIVSCRRAGSTAALDQLNKYFTINQMPVVSSQYWNMVHGNTPDQVRLDEEGMQIMRTLGRNMAWMLKCIEAGRNAGIDVPQPEEQRMVTNFIR